MKITKQKYFYYFLSKLFTFFTFACNFHNKHCFIVFISLILKECEVPRNLIIVKRYFLHSILLSHRCLL